MKIRALGSTDISRLRALFESQGLQYELPDLRMMVSAQVIEHEGEIVQAVLARPTVELYFIADSGWKTPAWRMEALKAIHESVRRELQGKGFADAHVWVPPQKKTFVRRLMKTFGWTLPMWTGLTRSTEAR